MTGRDTTDRTKGNPKPLRITRTEAMELATGVLRRRATKPLNLQGVFACRVGLQKLG